MAQLDKCNSPAPATQQAGAFLRLCGSTSYGVAPATVVLDCDQMVHAARLRPDAVFHNPLQYDRLAEWLERCTRHQLPS